MITDLIISIATCKYALFHYSLVLPHLFRIKRYIISTSHVNFNVRGVSKKWVYSTQSITISTWTILGLYPKSPQFGVKT